MKKLLFGHKSRINHEPVTNWTCGCQKICTFQYCRYTNSTSFQRINLPSSFRQRSHVKNEEGVVRPPASLAYTILLFFTSHILRWFDFFGSWLQDGRRVQENTLLLVEEHRLSGFVFPGTADCILWRHRTLSSVVLWFSAKLPSCLKSSIWHWSRYRIVWRQHSNNDESSKI